MGLVFLLLTYFSASSICCVSTSWKSWVSAADLAIKGQPPASSLPCSQSCHECIIFPGLQLCQMQTVTLAVICSCFRGLFLTVPLMVTIPFETCYLYIERGNTRWRSHQVAMFRSCSELSNKISGTLGSCEQITFSFSVQNRRGEKKP